MQPPHPIPTPRRGEGGNQKEEAIKNIGSCGQVAGWRAVKPPSFILPFGRSVKGLEILYLLQSVTRQG